MQFLEISHEIAGTSGSDIPVGMDEDGGIVSFVGVERRDSSGGVRGIVVRELGKRKKGAPVILLVIAVSVEILFKCLVNSFSLSVSFRMITRGEMNTHV